MIYSDLHCDTATELFRLQQTPETAQTHINSRTLASFEKICQTFAVFVDDTKPVDAFPYYQAVRRYTDPFWAKYPHLTPLFSIEGGGAIVQDNLQRLETLKQDGVRIFGLVWNGQNPLATGAVKDDTAGLTPLGRQCCKELERYGMVPDVSHLSAQGFRDLARATDLPVLATHSNAKACWDHPRNLADDQIREIGARKGLIGLNLCPCFIGTQGTLDELLQHAEHILNLGGEHVLALGCDFDGIDTTPPGICDGADLPVLQAMLQARFGKVLANRIMFQNVYDFFQI